MILVIINSHFTDEERNPGWVSYIGIKGQGFPDSSVVNNLPANAGKTGDVGSIPVLGISHRGGNGNPLKYSCLENPRDRGAWWSAIRGVTKSRTQLNDIRDKIITFNLGFLSLGPAFSVVVLSPNTTQVRPYF